MMLYCYSCTKDVEPIVFQRAKARAVIGGGKFLCPKCGGWLFVSISNRPPVRGVERSQPYYDGHAGRKR